MERNVESCFGTLEIKVNGKVVDRARITKNGRPEIKVAGSNLLENRIYSENINDLKDLAKELALREYDPNIFTKLFRKSPEVEVNYQQR